MECSSGDFESSLSGLSRQDAGNRHADGGCLLPVDEPRHRDGLRGLIPREPLSSNPLYNTSEHQNGTIYRRAYCDSLDFQMDQYLGYLNKVRAAHIEPKDLIHGPGIAENGHSAPPADFWCLITVRDRLVSQSKSLCEHIRVERREAQKFLSGSSLYCGILTCVSAFGSAAVLTKDKWYIPSILAAGAAPLFYLAPEAVKFIVTHRCEHILHSIIRRAENWDLDQEGREKLEQLAYWLRLIL